MASSITHSSSCEFIESDVIEIVPAEEYDSHRAKLRASLSWLTSKVYGSDVPKELQDPFYETAEGQLVLRPVMVNLLSSSELYCQACSNMFPETHTQWQGHWSIIQVLSRKGIYISDVQESAVTETVLVQTAPFRLKAHLALIDALMKAYTSEVASVEKVVKAVRRITTFPASSELPGSPEEALKFWINKVCTVVATEGVDTGGAGEIIEGEAGQKVRVVNKSASPRECVQVPLLEDLMRDIGDGCSVAAVIAYYRPQLLNIKDLCLKESIGIADSLYNLRQIGQFCRNHLPWKNFHLAYEDLLYTHEVMRVNILAFLADLFFCFEGAGSAVSALAAAKEKVDAIPAAGKRSSQVAIPSVPISNATKKSFQRPAHEDTASNLGMRNLSTSPGSHQPLLPRRTGRRSFTQEDGGFSGSPPSTRRSGRRTLSLSSPQEREQVQRSVMAWQDDQRISNRVDDRDGDERRSNLLANVSIDSAVDQSFNADASLSLDLGDLDTPRSINNSALHPNHPDYMEVESVTSGQPSRLTDRMTTRTPTSADHRLEPLMPAVLKPTKERETNLSKAEERGDRLPRKKKMASPSEPHPPSPSPSQPQRSAASQPPQQPQQQQFMSDDLAVSLSETQSPRYMPQAQDMNGRPYEAFEIGADSSASQSQQLDISTELTPPNSGRAPSTAGSYVVQDRAHTAQSARLAGIPIVADSGDLARSREGSVASSGEYSDHESQKIHQDHKIRESGSLPVSPKVATTNLNNNSTKPIMIITNQTPTSGGDENGGIFGKSPSSLTTNFAELKRMKDKLGYNIDKVDNSALIYMQSGSHGGPYDKMSGVDLKSTFGSKQGQGQSPGQGDAGKTSQQGMSSHSSDNAAVEANGGEPGSSELQQLRMKLEQKRKEIERKKHRQAAQQNKMSQRLGKAAFMRVVSKHLDGGDEESDLVDTTRSEPPPTSTQAQLQARLGHPAQKQPVGLSAKGQTQGQHPLQMLAQGGQGSGIPADVSAQRFTDWRTQTQLSKAGGGGGGGGAARPGSLDQSQQHKAFSRESMQQTIDNVKNKWFKNDSDLISGGGAGSEEEEEVDGDVNSYRLHGQDFVAGVGAGGGARGVREHSQTPPRSHSQSPRLGATQASQPVPIPTRNVTASPRPIPDEEYQEYDASLDKLNSSLTELQGEIMRLSLQHEQMKAASSPVGAQPGGFNPRLSEALTAVGSTSSGTAPAPSRPIHGIPQQAPYKHAAMAQQPAQGVPSAPQQQQQPPFTSVPYQNYNTVAGNPNTFLSDLNDSQQNRSDIESSSPADQSRLTVENESEQANSTNDGFFISFGEEATPKRSKPKLSDHRARGVSPGPKAGHAGGAGAGASDAAALPEEVTAALAGQAVIATKTPQKQDQPDEGASPIVGFIIKDQEALAKEQAAEIEMEKKKLKLMEMQRKRKEEQEKKKLEKEAELIRKQEEKMLKDEEVERKKAEDKARREVIFQQYLQKKQEEDETTVKPRVKKRDNSASKPRPKSMFVKGKPMTPEPGMLAPDSASSSQEDLTGRTALGGRSTPGIMSAMRSSYHFRLPQPSRMRKAVSCNTLQGSPNGAQGLATYRRPPSPDLHRLKQQRQRGNSQDSGSDGGSGSNPGSDYAGPKLFVKPSAKSNRHIIVNAISHCCLAGSVNTDLKNKVLEEMSKCEANHFLILFRDAGCQYRGLFIFYPETEEAFKIYGVGPKHITNKMCEKFYKYNSGAKSFTEITSTKHLSVSVDAVVLQSSVWKTGKAAIKR